MDINVNTNIYGSLVPTTINGVAHFWQSSAPTVRNDGSSLVVGDRFYSTSNNQSWFWNGTYWLSEQVIIFGNPTATTFSASGTSNFSYLPKYTGVFVEELRLIYGAAATQDATNFYGLGYHFAIDTNTGTNNTTTVNLGDTKTDSTANTNYKIFYPNAYVAAITGSSRITQFRVVITKNGTAGNLSRFFFSVRIREVL